MIGSTSPGRPSCSRAASAVSTPPTTAPATAKTATATFSRRAGAANLRTTDSSSHASEKPDSAVTPTAASPPMSPSIIPRPANVVSPGSSAVSAPSTNAASIVTTTHSPTWTASAYPVTRQASVVTGGGASAGGSP